jgi:hypothetical protein
VLAELVLAELLLAVLVLLAAGAVTLPAAEGVCKEGDGSRGARLDSCGGDAGEG